MLKKIFFLVAVAILIWPACFSFSSPVLAAGDYDGKLIKMKDSSAVYYVAEGKRYVFPNENIFKSWFPDFSDVLALTYEELLQIPLGGNVFYRPGAVLIKITTSPTVYAVANNGVLRSVQSEAMVRALYGSNWHLLIDDVPDSFFTNYTIGDTISDETDYDPDQEIIEADTIEYNKGLRIRNATRARTGKCKAVMSGSSYVRECEQANSNNAVDDNSAPYIKTIKATSGDDDMYVNEDDMIAIAFNESINPESINNDLEAGSYVSGVAYTETGGVYVSSSGRVTIRNIAIFDMGSIESAATFTVKLALNSSGKILTITLTSGDEVEIIDENFDDARQIGGTIEDVSGNEMVSNESIDDPTGSFSDREDIDDDDNTSSSDLYIQSIYVYNNGRDGSIDALDAIRITFSEAVNPGSINSGLQKGGYVNDVTYTETGGVRISSLGIVTIKRIAAFDMGSVGDDSTFTVKLALDSSGKILTIALTGDDDVEITDEDFDDAEQTGGTVEDANGNEMDDDERIDDPKGTFGGVNENPPYILSVRASDGGDDDYIDVDDEIIVTFSKAIDPASIDDDLEEEDDISGVEYSQTGGVSVSSSGDVTIKNIATFDMGSVEDSGNFEVELALSANGRVLTITLTDGDDVEIEEEVFDDLAQTGGTIEDKNGRIMEGNAGLDDLTGSFGGGVSDNDDEFHITSIRVSDDGNDDYIDVGDEIKITFSRSIDPESIDNDLENGYGINDVDYTDTGGVRVSSSGRVTIKNIATFDVGSVDESEVFTVDIDLSSNGEVLTIVLVDGDDVEIINEDFDDAEQVGGTIEDESGDEMDDDESIDDPVGTFGGDNTSDDGSAPYIKSIAIANHGTSGYIDVGDTIALTFNEALDPESINPYLEVGDYVDDILYSRTGGITVISGGAVSIEDIAYFDVGSVDRSLTYTAKLAMNADGDVLTITLMSGGNVRVVDNDFSRGVQIGGIIEDESGNTMVDKSSIIEPSGSF